MFGRSANAFQNFESAPTATASKAELESRLQYMNSIVFPAIQQRTKESQVKTKSKFDRTHRIVTPTDFPLGCEVLHCDPTVTILGAKHLPKFPHRAKVVGYGSYGNLVLQNLDGTIQPRDTPPSHVRLFQQKRTKSEPSYAIDLIVNHRIADGIREEDAVGSDYEYDVLWKCIPPVNTWEPFEHFDDHQCIRDYWKRNQLARPPPGFVLSTHTRPVIPPANPVLNLEGGNVMSQTTESSTLHPLRHSKRFAKEIAAGSPIALIACDVPDH